MALASASVATVTTDAALARAVPVCDRMAHAVTTTTAAEVAPSVAAAKSVEIIDLTSSSENTF
jgi:hypothetical protein